MLQNLSSAVVMIGALRVNDMFKCEAVTSGRFEAKKNTKTL